MSKLKNFIYPLATLSGTIIGVGIFALPYIASKVGIWVMLAYLLVLGGLVIMIHSFFGELALKTPDYKRLPGFARIYLGKWGEKTAIFSAILGSFGVILAYLIVSGEFLMALLGGVLGGSVLIYTLVYFALGAAMIYFGTKAVAQVEFWGVVLFFAILVAIFFRGQPFLEIKNLFPSPDWNFFFLPYGAILFSLWGMPLIPEVEEMLGERKKWLKIIIAAAILIAVIIYLFFIYLILGITGSQTTESALPGLRNLLGDGIVSLAVFFGIVTTFTSFIALGMTLKKVFWYDLKMNKNLAWLISCFPPLILFLIGVKSFIPIISFVGAVMLGIDGILILLMYRKIRPRNLLVYPLLLILLGGIIYEILYFVR
jgi:tyrosine-specific transport protein